MVESSVRVGERMPEFRLSDQAGTSWSLPTGKPTILVFFRGQWCPYCRWELTGLQTINRAVIDAGGEIVGVSPDSPDESADLQKRLELKFAILSDPDLAVTDSFGLRHVGGRASTGQDLPFPTTFIVDAQGVVRATLENETYRDRPAPPAVLAAFRQVIVSQATR